jgi:hypothetical protein
VQERTKIQKNKRWKERRKERKMEKYKRNEDLLKKSQLLTLKSSRLITQAIVDEELK